MRIGLVVEQFDPRRGGLEQWTAQLCEGLLARGHEVHAVAGRFGEQIARLPIRTHLLEGFHSRIGFAEAAQRKLESLDLDVIHDTGVGWYCDVFQPHWGSWAALGQRKLEMIPRWMRPLKRIAFHLLPRYQLLRRLTARQYANDGRLVMALSKRVAADFQQFHGVDPAQIRLVYNGVDTLRFSPDHRQRYRDEVRRRLGVSPDTLLLLIVAHNFRLKGVPMLLRAMGRLAARRRPVHLVVVGGKRLKQAGREAQRLGAADAVSFVGPSDNVVPYYAAADVYVHPTFYDSFSLVVLEAMASGLPVVTSRYNGVVELFSDGVEGYLLSDPDNVDEFLWQVDRLFDPALRARMGAAARRLAERHSFDQNVQQVLAVYEEVLRRGSHRHPHLARPFVCRTYGAGQAAPGRVESLGSSNVPVTE